MDYFWSWSRGEYLQCTKQYRRYRNNKKKRQMKRSLFDKFSDEIFWWNAHVAGKQRCTETTTLI